MKKRILISIIIILIIFTLYLIFYRYNIYDKNKKEYVYNVILIKENKTVDEFDKNLIEKYSKKIIKEPLLSIDYQYFDKNLSILGKIYIDNENLLHLTNQNNRSDYIVSKIKFKTIYKSDYIHKDILLYLISTDSKLYYLSLNSNDTAKVVVNEIKIKNPIQNFTNLNYKSDLYNNSASLFILDSANNIYDVTSGINYKENIISLYNKYYILENNKITNIYGNILKDKNDKEYKIKNFFIINLTDSHKRGIIITDDNRLIYVDDTHQVLYEFEEKIKKIEYNQQNIYVNDTLKIVFEDGYTMEYNAMCSSYFCINNNN